MNEPSDRVAIDPTRGKAIKQLFQRVPAEAKSPHLSGSQLWRGKFDGMNVSDAKRLKELVLENARLKGLLAETMRENELTKEAMMKKCAHRPGVNWCTT
jgi:hypothetical protein